MRGPQVVAVASGHVAAHERGSRLVGLDAVTGAVRWDVPLGTWPRAVVAAGALVWVRDGRGGLTAVDATTAEVNRRLDPGERPVADVVSTVHGPVVARRSGVLLRVDHDGTIREGATAVRRVDALHALTPDTVLLAGAGGLRAVSPP
ncbi:hypothetical protein [Micromonospora sp. DT31]|uniref:hypothetical protein n=1 Tax=Micromonospora sp. DT31 TaxID=3393434 RepID=UPI003CF95669